AKWGRCWRPQRAQSHSSNVAAVLVQPLAVGVLNRRLDTGCRDPEAVDTGRAVTVPCGPVLPSGHRFLRRVAAARSAFRGPRTAVVMMGGEIAPIHTLPALSVTLRRVRRALPATVKPLPGPMSLFLDLRRKQRESSRNGESFQ